MRKVFLCSVTLLASFAFAADNTRPIADTDLYSFHWIADAQISPDGSRIVYTQINVNPKHDNYETALWEVAASGGQPRRITSGVQSASARWSPDSKRIVFLRPGEKDGKPLPPQIFLLPMDGGGEAYQLGDVPKGANRLAWSPDGRSIAFGSETPKRDDPDQTDVRVITRAEYRSNGAGYPTADNVNHLWTIDTTSGRSVQLTTGDFDEENFVWSKDGSKIYFISDRTKESYYQPGQNAIYSIPAGGGAIEKITGIDGQAGSMALSPDGSRIAFTGAVNKGDNVIERSYSQPDLFVAGVAPGSTPKNLTAGYDFDVAGGVGGDQAPPRAGGGPRPWWSADGHDVIVVCGEKGRTNLKRINAGTGKVEPLTDGDFDLFSYSASADNTKIAALISTPVNIGDLFSVDGKTGSMKQLTHINADLFSQLKVTQPEMIWYKSFDGKQIQAWVQRPPDFRPGTKYPLILNIHGGPHSAYGYTFDHEFQTMAAKGYVVLYPNPRGSTTYGQDFGNVIQYHYPGDDFKDLMAGVDDLVARGWVDPEKLGVTGGSGGGVLTNWVIGHTTRFKAAVSQRSIADWSAWWYTADFTQFNAPWFKGAPWEYEADFRERSPITYVKQITTPLMLIEGESDFRTPPTAGGEQMFRALKYLKKPVVMVRFPNETHELSRSGNPRHRVERLHHITGWFDKYLEGNDTHEYDVR